MPEKKKDDDAATNSSTSETCPICGQKISKNKLCNISLK